MKSVKEVSVLSRPGARTHLSSLATARIVAIFAFLSLFGSASAQIPSLGRCPDFPVVKKFDVSSYLGKWYEIEKFFAVFELGGTCITATYTDLGNGTVGVFNAQTQALSRKRRTISGTARVVDPDEGAKLAVRFPSVPFAGEAPYWVLDTDYQNYAVVWSCNNLAFMNFQIVWFLARDRFPQEDIRKKVHHTMDSLGLDTSRLQKTEQTKCPETY